MNEENSLAIIFAILILTIGGCLYGTNHDGEVTNREREKTKQMEIQARMDSAQIINNFKNKKYGQED